MCCPYIVVDFHHWLPLWTFISLFLDIFNSCAWNSSLSFTSNTRQDYRKWWFRFPNMLNMVLHLKWLPNVFELWKLVHREAPEIHFFLTPGVGRLSVQLRQHNKLLCLILEAGKKCCSGSLVWVNLNNSNESDLHSQWGTWFCMLEMRSSQRLMLHHQTSNE